MKNLDKYIPWSSNQPIISAETGKLETPSAMVRIGGFISRNLPMLALCFAFALALVMVAPAHVLADDTAPDASTIVTTATSTFDLVGGLVASAVGFFIIVKIVKWIRK